LIDVAIDDVVGGSEGKGPEKAATASFGLKLGRTVCDESGVRVPLLSSPSSSDWPFGLSVEFYTTNDKQLTANLSTKRTYLSLTCSSLACCTKWAIIS